MLRKRMPHFARILHLHESVALFCSKRSHMLNHILSAAFHPTILPNKKQIQNEEATFGQLWLGDVAL